LVTSFDLDPEGPIKSSTYCWKSWLAQRTEYPVGARTLSPAIRMFVERTAALCECGFAHLDAFLCGVFEGSIVFQLGLVFAVAMVAGGTERLPNTCCLILPGVSSHLQVMTLDLAGLCVSAGAACSSGKVSRSHVLEAMGLGALAGCAVRVSLPWNATQAHVLAFADAYPAMAARLSRRPA
jgi:hypothetical protein